MDTIIVTVINIEKIDISGPTHTFLLIVSNGTRCIM